METKGIIISKKDYERLTELEKNFDNKVKENRESFKKVLEDAIKGNLVKFLWVNDKRYAEIMGCDLSEDGIDKFISKEIADMLDKTSNVSYNHNKAKYGFYQEIIDKQKIVIRNLWLAFGFMFVAWMVQLIVYIMK